jgi:hypothetical protein
VFDNQVGLFFNLVLLPLQRLEHKLTELIRTVLQPCAEDLPAIHHLEVLRKGQILIRAQTL